MSHGSPLHGNWFPSPTGVLLGAFCHLSLVCFIRHPAMSRSPLPHSLSGPIPASRGLPFSRGCGAAFAPLLSWSCPLIPSLIPSLYPTGRQQPSGAGPQDPHSSGDRLMLLARVAPIPSSCLARMVLSVDQSRVILSGASGHISHVHALLAYLCIGTRTQRLYAAEAQQGRHYTYPY